MRNLKRVLSLALALVMILGMMVMGAGAASTDFDDGAEINNAEAADVMTAIEVFTGSDDGNFYPGQILTRAEAATIICRMLMGPENAATLAGTMSTTEYTDVPANAWYAPYVAYCSNLGIISGDGAGHFFPTGKLTGIAFGKMLLIALGYDAAIEGYINDPSYASKIMADMIEAGINISGIDMNAELSRDDACQMALQTLEANVVTYANKGTNINMPDGTSVIVGASAAATVTAASEGIANYAGTGAGADGLGTRQFCEKYFPELRKNGTGNDAFGRNAEYVWYLDADDSKTKTGNESGVHAAMPTPVATFTTAKNPNAVLNSLKGYTFGSTKLTAVGTTIGTTEGYTDLTITTGTQITTAISGKTGNGVLVEVYADSAQTVTDIIVIEYTVEEVVSVSTNNDGDVTYNLSVSGPVIDRADKSADDTVVLNGDVAKGDIVTTVLDTNSDVQVYPTTVIVGAQSAYNVTDATVTVDGTVYTVATGVTEDGVSDYLSVAGDFGTNSIVETNYYLDQFGYVVACDPVVYGNYAQLKGINVSLKSTVDGKTPTVEARFVMADGTVGVYTVELTKAGSNYQLFGTNVYTGSEAVTAIETNLGTAGLVVDQVYAYELDEDTISLQNSVGTTVAAGAMIQARDTTPDTDPSVDETYINTGDTSVTLLSTSTLLTNETVYILYNANKKAAEQYVGSLPANATLDDINTVVVAQCVDSDADTYVDYAVAKFVFGSTADVAASDTGDYAYVVASDVTVELINDKSYGVYEGYTNDGSTVTLYDSVPTAGNKKITADGLYTWDEKGNVVAAYTGSHIKAAQTYTVVGDQIKGADGSVYNMNDAVVVYTSKKVSTLNGSNCIVVLAKSGGKVTNSAATIFVIE